MIKISIILLLITKILNWWSHGHMIITRIAEKKLAEKKMDLSKINEMLKPIQEYFPETENSFLEASIVPDLLVSEYSGFLEFFHFVDNPIIYWNDKKDDINIPDNFYQNVTFAIKISKEAIKKSLEHKLEVGKGFMDSLLLRYLLHTVGDIHQPLHCSSLFSKYKFKGLIKEGDMGGNLIEIYDPITLKTINLHSYWDSVLGLYTLNPELPLSEEAWKKIDSDADFLIEKFPVEFFEGKDKILDEKIWSEESYNIAITYVYRNLDFFPYLSANYIEEGRSIAMQRLVLAGYRLGELLFDLFNNPQKIKGFEI